MSHGRASNDTFRIATQQIVAAPVTKRQTCRICRNHKSIGQFAVGEDVCAKCSGKPVGWRRGDL
jgi:hypothetical protein